MKDPFKCELVEIDLVSLNAFKTDEDLEIEEIPLEVKRETDIDILDIRNDQIKVRLKEEIFFKPRSPIKVNLEVHGKFRVDGPVEQEKILSQIEKSMYPMFAKASMVAAFVTNEMLGSPLILPPFREKETSS